MGRILMIQMEIGLRLVKGKFERGFLKKTKLLILDTANKMLEDR